MAATWKARFMDIPVKVLINNILLFCEAKDVLSLGCTNKFFALIANDGTFWKQKLAVNYNFTGSETARMSGWKLIYQKLRKPQVFVWGCVTFSFCYVMVYSFAC
jgi:SCF-associated factor 1